MCEASVLILTVCFVNEKQNIHQSFCCFVLNFCEYAQFANTLCIMPAPCVGLKSQG